MSKPFGQKAVEAGLGLMPGQSPDCVTLWDLDEETHTDAVCAGLCKVTLTQYRQRVSDAKESCRRKGIRVVMVRASVDQVLQTIAADQLPEGSAGQAAAIGLIASRTGQL